MYVITCHRYTRIHDDGCLIHHGTAGASSIGNSCCGGGGDDDDDVIVTNASILFRRRLLLLLRSVLNRQRHIFVDDDAYSPVSASSFSSGVFATVTTTMGDAEKTTVTAMAIVGIVQRKGHSFAPASWAQFYNCGGDFYGRWYEANTIFLYVAPKSRFQHCFL